MNLDIMCCPLCFGNLYEIKDKVICSSCKKEYKYKDGIPVLLLEYISL